MADEYEAPRDALVKYSIQRLKSIIEQERRKLEFRKKIASKFKAELEDQKKLFNEANHNS